jgi:hypothetical protein
MYFSCIVKNNNEFGSLSSFGVFFFVALWQKMRTNQLVRCHFLLCSFVVDDDKPIELITIFFVGCIELKDDNELTKLVVVFCFIVEHVGDMCQSNN